MALAPQSARYSTPAALVTLPAMMGNWGNASRNTRTVSPTPRLWPCAGGNRHDVHAAFHERADVVQNACAVKFAKGVARGRNRRATNEMKPRVARRFELRAAFLRDALDVAHREQAAQVVLVIHNEQFVNAKMFVEKFVGARDGVLAEFLLGDGLNLGAGREGVGNFAFGVARLDDVAESRPTSLPLPSTTGKVLKPNFFCSIKASTSPMSWPGATWIGS